MIADSRVLENGGLSQMTNERWKAVASSLGFERPTEELINCMNNNYIGEFAAFEK
jgi:hypothetical protein